MLQVSCCKLVELACHVIIWDLLVRFRWDDPVFLPSNNTKKSTVLCWVGLFPSFFLAVIALHYFFYLLGIHFVKHHSEGVPAALYWSSQKTLKNFFFLSCKEKKISTS